MNFETQTNLSRICKQCQVAFEIKIIDAGRGSGNALRRVFCSAACKGVFGREKSENKVEQSCQKCKTPFLRYPSQSGKFCSYTCKNNNQIRLASAICKQCSLPFQAKPTRLNAFYCSRECFHNAGREERKCITCSAIFQTKKTNQNVRCSRRCQFTDQSNGKIKLHLNGRTGYRSDFGFEYYFKSSLEADFARLMKFWNISFAYEAKTFQTQNGAYTPDFYLTESDVYVELKGVENDGKSYSKMMRKNLISHPSLGVKIITITQKQFIQILKDANLWNTLPNLEERNYKKTLHLVTKHENQATSSNSSLATNPIN